MIFFDSYLSLAVLSSNFISPCACSPMIFLVFFYQSAIPYQNYKCERKMVRLQFLYQGTASLSYEELSAF